MMARMDLQTPCLLVASPLLLDPNFLHSVVLVIEHDENGAMGIILNRPLPLNLAQICAESYLTFAGDDESTAYRGGPVEPQRGIILVRGGLPSEEDTVLNFTDFVSFRKDLLETLLLDPEACFRLFLGYAGWASGQLEAEIAQGAWAVCPVKPEWLMSEEPRMLWQRAIESGSSTS
ncbi:MAG: YqgE/AlgH family protein [Holophaga sp.]|nr:YqgE/AlgH family protein [Holophaga sp.]